MGLLLPRVIIIIIMPKVFVQFLEGNNIYVCGKCGTHLSSLAELISKAFRGQHGTAYLFHSV